MVDDKVQKRQLWDQKRQKRLSENRHNAQIEEDNRFSAHTRFKSHLGLGQGKAFMRIIFIGALLIAGMVFLF